MDKLDIAKYANDAARLLGEARKNASMTDKGDWVKVAQAEGILAAIVSFLSE